MKKVLCVAVHPDDETLGAGGTLLKHKARGDEVHWLIVTQTQSGTDFYKQRQKEIDAVAQAYGFDSVTQCDFIASTLGETNQSELIDRIKSVFNEINPEVVYLPFYGDVHSDHRNVFEAATAACKSFRAPQTSNLSH